MVAYAFPKADAEILSTGARLFTLQPPRSERARHAQVGEPMTLRIGSAANGLTIEAVCIVRATVHIAETGLRRVLEEHRSAFHYDEATTILARFIEAEDAMPNAPGARERLAKELGFTDWTRMVRSTAADARGRLKGGVMARELVGWRLKG